MRHRPWLLEFRPRHELRPDRARGKRRVGLLRGHPGEPQDAENRKRDHPLACPSHFAPPRKRRSSRRKRAMRSIRTSCGVSTDRWIAVYLLEKIRTVFTKFHIGSTAIGAGISRFNDMSSPEEGFLHCLPDSPRGFDSANNRQRLVLRGRHLLTEGERRLRRIHSLGAALLLFCAQVDLSLDPGPTTDTDQTPATTDFTVLPQQGRRR